MHYKAKTLNNMCRLATVHGLFPLRQFPLCQFPLRQFPLCQFPLRQVPGLEKLGSHIVRYSRSLLTSAWFSRCRWTWFLRIFLMHLFQHLLEGVFWISVAMSSKFKSLICDSIRGIQDLVWARDSWSLHCKTCLGRASGRRVAIERRKESFLVVMRSAMVDHPRRVYLHLA